MRSSSRHEGWGRIRKRKRLNQLRRVRNATRSLQSLDVAVALSSNRLHRRDARARVSHRDDYGGCDDGLTDAAVGTNDAETRQGDTRNCLIPMRFGQVDTVRLWLPTVIRRVRR